MKGTGIPRGLKNLGLGVRIPSPVRHLYLPGRLFLFLKCSLQAGPAARTMLTGGTWQTRPALDRETFLVRVQGEQRGGKYPEVVVRKQAADELRT